MGADGFEREPGTEAESMAMSDYLHANADVVPSEVARLRRLRQGECTILFGYVGSAFRVCRPRRGR